MSLGRQGARGGEEDSYLASLSDLMVGLLFVFVIMLMAFGLNYRTAQDRTRAAGEELSTARDAAETERQRLAAEVDELEAERQRLRQQLAAVVRQRDELGELSRALAERDLVRNAMLQRVQDLLAQRAVLVSIDLGNGILRLSEGLLFESGAPSLRAEGERALRELASALARSLPCYSLAPPVMQSDCRQGAEPILETVLIEGHTDDRPFAGGAPFDNWTLAALRGVNTFKALVRYQPALDMLRNARGEALLGVSSYEARRPVTHDPAPEAQRLNRRIDLRFVVAAPAGDELARLRRRLAPSGHR
jgi:flagellar motor protein MotB